jgi:hypothetical protein
MSNAAARGATVSMARGGYERVGAGRHAATRSKQITDGRKHGHGPADPYRSKKLIHLAGYLVKQNYRFSWLKGYMA